MQKPISELGLIQNEDVVSRATDASVDGSIVVGWLHDRLSHKLDAFIWTKDKGQRLLKDVLVNDYKLAANRFQTDPKGESELLSDTEKLENGLHLVNRRVDMFVIIE